MKKSKKLLLLIPTVFLLSLFVVAIVAFLGLEYHATKTVKTQIEQNIEELSNYVKVEYENLTINWLAFTVNLKKVRLSKPPLPGVITIDQVSVRDLTSIGIKWIPTVVAFDNLALTNEEINLSVQSLYTTFRLTSIPSQEELAKDWTVFFDNLRSGEVHLKKVVLSEKESQLQISLDEAEGSLDNGTQRHSSLKTSGLKFQKQDLQFQSDTLSVAVSLSQNDVLTRLAQQVKNFTMQFPPGLAEQYPFLQKLTALGYDRLAFGMDLNYDYQPASQNVSIVWDASATNMGQLHFSLGLADYASPPLPLKGGPARFLVFLQQLITPPQDASLQGLKLRYQDFGLVPRLIKAEAQSRNQSPEAFTQKIVGTINTSLLILPLPASLKEQVKAVNRFLKKPEEIQLSITSKKPLRLKNFREGSFEGFFDLLDNAEVKITSK